MTLEDPRGPSVIAEAGEEKGQRQSRVTWERPGRATVASATEDAAVSCGAQAASGSQKSIGVCLIEKCLK